MKLKLKIYGLMLGLALASLAWGMNQKTHGPVHGVGPLPPPECVPYPDPLFGCKDQQPAQAHK